MKKFILLFEIAWALMLFSCQAIFESDTASGIENQLSATKSIGDYTVNDVSINEAIALATAHHQEGPLSIEPFCEGKDTLLFICSFDKGWMIIAADKRAKPILAMGKEDSINSFDELPHGFQIWLQSIATDLSEMKKDKTLEHNENTAFWELFAQKNNEPGKTKSRNGMKWYAVCSGTVLTSMVEADIIPHIITTKWGQGYPWNSKCPLDASNDYERCYLGCMATAVGQLLYFTHSNLYKPDALYHTIYCTKDTILSKTSNIGFVRGDLNNPSSRWNSMALNQYGSSTGIEYAGDLMLDIGNRLGLNYSAAGTGTSALDPSAMSTYYHLYYSTGSYDYATVLSNLNNNLPVLVSAYSVKQGLTYKKGHMWLIDGLHETQRNYYYTKHFEYSEDWVYYSEVYDTFDEIHQIYHIQDPNEEIDCYTSTTTNYLLMNWGYDGLFDNDYYSIYPNDNWYANSGNHQYLRTIYYGIH